MRKELELIQKIEHYLLGEMAPPEALTFEKELAGNKELQEEVELQKQIMKGMRRTIWRQDAQKAFAKYTFMKKLLKWGYIGTSILVLTLSISYFLNPKESLDKVAAQNISDTVKNINALADTENIYNILNGNSFVINATRDTVVKTKDGKLIEIPKELFMDTLIVEKNDSTLLHNKTNNEGTQAKIYTLHFYSPSYPDTLKKWKQAIKDKKYASALRSMLSNVNPKNYLKTSSKEQQVIGKSSDTLVSVQTEDTMYKAVCGINMEKIKTNLTPKTNSPLYKLKGKIPFINKTAKNKNTILVFDIDNKNKSTIDTAIVIEVVDKLKDKTIITKKEK